MTLEKIIANVSRALAFIVVFALADGFYLSQKGFVLENGKMVLSVKEANAKEVPQNDLLMTIKPTGFIVEETNVLGDVNAPITIYEFSSLGCSHCSDFHLDTLPKLKKDYIDSGKVKLVFVDFPIDNKSMQASMLARCMPKDKYFDFLSLLFKKQTSWGLSFKTDKILVSYAEIEGMPAEEAQACLKNDEIAKEIMYGRQQAMEKLNIQGTPSFLVRKGEKEQLLPGAPTYEKLQEIINQF